MATMVVYASSASLPNGQTLSPSGIAIGYRDITRNSLVLYLDARKIESYPGSGTVWFDLSGLGKNATIVSGTYFSNNLGGSIITNGVNFFKTPQIPGIGTSTNSLTFAMWVCPSSTQGNIMSMASVDPQTGWNMPPIVATASLFAGAIYPSTNTYATGTFNTGSYYYVALVFDNAAATTRLYINGVVHSSQSAVSYGGSGADNYLFFGQTNPGVGNMGMFAGAYSSIEVYTRALSAAEILHNYYTGMNLNTDIVRSGLVLNIDAADPRSNPPGTSSLYDISGFSVPVNLINPGNLTVTSSDGFIYFNNPDASGSLYSYYAITDSSISSITDEITLETVFIPVSYLSGANRISGCPTSPRHGEVGEPVGGVVYEGGVGIEINVSGAWVTVYSAAPGVGLGKLSTVTWTTSKSALTAKAFVNGLPIFSTSFGTGSIATGNGIDIGRTYYGGIVNSNSYFIATRYYNRALSAPEILQNHNYNLFSLSKRNYTTSSLAFYITTTNPKSYPGTGTSWYDLGPSSSIALLSGSPAIDVDGNGGLVFDGSTIHSNCAIGYSYLSSSTCECFFKLGAVPTTQKGLFGYRGNPGYSLPTIGLIYFSANARINASVITLSEVYRNVASTTVLEAGKTYHVAFTKDVQNGVMKLFVNGNLEATTTFNKDLYAQWTATGTFVGEDRLDIGKNTNDNASQGWDTNRFNGTMYTARVYGKILTQAEIINNFNEAKRKMGNNIP